MFKKISELQSYEKKIFFLAILITAFFVLSAIIDSEGLFSIFSIAAGVLLTLQASLRNKFLKWLIFLALVGAAIFIQGMMMFPLYDGGINLLELMTYIIVPFIVELCSIGLIDENLRTVKDYTRRWKEVFLPAIIGVAGFWSTLAIGERFNSSFVWISGLILTAAITLTAMIHGWRYRKEPRARILSLIILAISMTAFVYLLVLTIVFVGVDLT
ncbi:MAG: hypothetical protein R3B52_00535 [Candidatus Paceibacterota bacterium]